MNSNFRHLAEEWPEFYAYALQAEQTVYTAPRTSAFYSRLTLEAVVDWLYDHDLTLHRPYQSTLSNLLQQYEFQQLPQLSPLMRDLQVIRQAGNAAAHSNQAPIPANRALLVLRKLHRFLGWFARNYSEEYPGDLTFEADWVPRKGAAEKSAQELQKLQEEFTQQVKALQEARKKLLESESEKARLQQELAAIQERKSVRGPQEAPPESPNEAETRTFLIDLQLAEAGWDLSAPESQEYEVTGMPLSTNPSGMGYVDYVLWGTDGLPLGLVEAKKTSISAKRGQHQAKLYADCLEKQFQRRPVIFYTNGYETYLWDDASYPPRPIQGFYTRAELELLHYRHLHTKDLRKQLTNKHIAGRYYQTQALTRIAEDFMDKRRDALLVMATGTGKTRTAIAAVDLLMKADWVRRVLFLADRKALVRQAKNSFKTHLPEVTSINLLEEKEDTSSRLVFSTYPTMMNRIDAARTSDNQYFGPGHFDLIIVDEAHRSVYQKYKALFEYFDALLLGLTATPKDELDRNTYSLFKRPDADPTYAYELDTAIKDKYLVPYLALNVPTRFNRKGIKYHELSEEEKVQYEALFRDEETGNIPEEIDSAALNRWLFNSDTVDKVLGFLMENGWKVEGGDQLGKTIIFAMNHRHAEFIEERFNLHYPAYKGGFLKVIDNYDKYAQKSLEDFSDPQKLPQIAVSVDMLDTGIDIPEILNLVLFKRVYSKSKFWQMLGRGTRLCEHLFGPDQHKSGFYVFDFCDNFTFFNENPEGIEPRAQESVTQKIFKARLALSEALQADEYQEAAVQALRTDPTGPSPCCRTATQHGEFPGSPKITVCACLSKSGELGYLKYHGPSRYCRTFVSFGGSRRTG